MTTIGGQYQELPCIPVKSAAGSPVWWVACYRESKPGGEMTNGDREIPWLFQQRGRVNNSGDGDDDDGEKEVQVHVTSEAENGFEFFALR